MMTTSVSVMLVSIYSFTPVIPGSRFQRAPERRFFSEDASDSTASCEEIDILPRIARRVAVCSIAAAGARRAFDLTRFPQSSCPSRTRSGLTSARKRSRRGSHDVIRDFRRHGPAVRFAKQAGAGGLHRRDLCQRAVVVFRAASVYQDGAAAARRIAGGVVGGDGVLPVAAARRLRLCACPDADQEPG